MINIQTVHTYLNCDFLSSYRSWANSILDKVGSPDANMTCGNLSKLIKAPIIILNGK